jgi:hypothetical protein
MRANLAVPTPALLAPRIRASARRSSVRLVSRRPPPRAELRSGRDRDRVYVGAMATYSNWTFELRPPQAPPVAADRMTLSASRDVMTGMQPDRAIQSALVATLERWRADAATATPLQELKDTLEVVRRMPRGEVRLRGMNTLVRTLGTPEALATLLDILRLSWTKDGTREQELARVAQEGKLHSIYGWCGQTSILFSESEPTEGTVLPTDVWAKDRLLYPASLWWLSIHIWQPNPRAQGFRTDTLDEPGVIVEPPHSHPFDFASMVSIGKMRQSIYSELGSGAKPRKPGRYDGSTLEHVDGVWPPHDYRRTVELQTEEDRLMLTAGDSYYLPCHRIHDVEVDTNDSRARPAITLFLASETLVVPHVYMATTMADYHAAHPDLIASLQPRALSAQAWMAKLEAVSDYLRGKSPTLCLDEIVKSDQEYAFFHA